MTESMWRKRQVQTLGEAIEDWKEQQEMNKFFGIKDLHPVLPENNAKVYTCDGHTSKMNDPVNNPSHYTEGREIEPIQAITDWDLDFCLGNVVKYVSRAGRKDKTKTIEDLKKARFYLDYHISRLQGDV